MSTIGGLHGRGEILEKCAKQFFRRLQEITKSQKSHERVNVGTFVCQKCRPSKIYRHIRRITSLVSVGFSVTLGGFGLGGRPPDPPDPLPLLPPTPPPIWGGHRSPTAPAMPPVWLSPPGTVGTTTGPGWGNTPPPPGKIPPPPGKASPRPPATPGGGSGTHPPPGGSGGKTPPPPTPMGGKMSLPGPGGGRSPGTQLGL